MSYTIRALVAIDSSVSRDTVLAAVPSDPSIDLVGLIDGFEDSWSALQETATDLVVVACSGYSDRALFFIEGALKQDPSRAVVVLSEGSPNGFLRRMFEAGADDVITLPESPDSVAFALRKAIARKQGAALASGVALGSMICVLGPKGGTGKTLTASNLAVSLAKADKRVALVDLDLQFGDMGLTLGLAPERTVYDLAKSGGTLDAEKLESYLVQHSSGVRVLLAPTRPDHASVVTIELLREVYLTLRASYDFVVVDTPPGFTPEVIASIDSSSHVCIVGMLDSLSIKNTKLGLETLELMGYPANHVSLVLNRADTHVGVTHEDVETILGRRPDVFVPSDREIPRSVNQGVPIVIERERSEAARSFLSLAAIYLGEAEEAEPTPELAKRDGGRRLLAWRS